MKKILTLISGLVFAMCLSAQVYYLLPNSDDQNCEAVTNVYDNTRNENMLKWETWWNGETEEVVCPERAAYDWFRDVYNGGAQKVITYKDLTDGRLASDGDLFNEVKVLWVNVDRFMTESELDDLFPAGVRTAIANYVKAGGNVYFSTFGVRVAYLIERTPEPGFSENDGFCCPTENWKLTAHFRKGEEYDVDKRGHAIYQVLRDHNTHPEGDYTCFHMQKGVRSDRNCLWNIDDNMEAFNNFQNINTCGILGSWGHTAEFLCAGLVEFYPVGDWKGTIITNGLAACSFAATNTDVFAVKELTKGVLDYLTQTPNLVWNSETVPASGVIGEDHYMTASATTGYTIRYAADHPEIANIGNTDGRVFYNYFGSTTFHATATGDGWNVPKATATIASGTITVNGGTEVNPRFAYVLPYSLHVMANYDNEEDRRPDYEAAQWFHDQFIAGEVGGEHGCFVRPSDLASLNPAIKVLWIHNDHVGQASDDYYNDLGGDTFCANLANFLANGGNVFVSKQATRLIGDLGRNEYPRYANGGYGDRDQWRIGNKWNFQEGGEVDRSTHRVYTGMGTGTEIMASGSHTDNNCVWHQEDNVFDTHYASNNAQRLTQYESDHNCVILGAWGHSDNNGVNSVLECVGFVEYKPQNNVTLNASSTTFNQQGTIIAMGLAAFHWANPTDKLKTLTRNTLSYLNFMNARPCALDNTTPMETKLAENGFYPDNTTTFLKLHPVCEGLSAAYTLTSNPDGIARIQEGVDDGEDKITQLQFKEAGTVTLHITLTETRDNVNWPTGTYEYDRAITFSYKDSDAAQKAVEADLSSDGKTGDRFMILHPNIRGLDSVSYTIVNNYGESGGQALKVKDSEELNAATRLCFTHKGSVQLRIKMNETDWVEAWSVGEKEFTKVVTFDKFERPEGPTMNWPLEFFKGGIEPNSVITLPAQIEGLTPTYTVTGDATVEGNTLTVGNVTSGSFTVTASVTENDYKLAWPVGTYQFEKSLPVYASEVGYLLPAAESIEHLAGWYDGEQPEYNAAKWFQDTYIATRQGRFVTLDELPTLFAKGIKTLWVNIERINITTEEGLFTDMPAPLKTYIQAGGNVLLTKQATRLAYLMERIGYAPEFNAEGYSTENTNNLRSIATCMGTGEGVNEPLDKSGHRLYSGMLSYWEGKNVFLVAPDCKKTMNYCSWQDFFTDGAEAHAYENNNIQRLKDFENAWSATVFGIQGSIGDYCFSDVVEFNATGDWKGRILAIGSAAYQWGTSNNHVELENMKTLTSNALSYLLDKPVEDEVYTRDIMNNMYGTICWGYAVEEGHIEGAEIYELTSFNATGDAIILTEVNSMMAGRAYFFFGTSDQLRLTYHGQKKEAEEGGHNGLVGYIPLMGSESYRVPANDNKYILYYDELLLVDSEIDLPAHRAYVDYNAIPSYQASAPANVRRRVMFINRYQAPTGLETVEHSAQSGSYDILGRKVNNPQSAGFYIINGKKVIITQ